MLQTPMSFLAGIGTGRRTLHKQYVHLSHRSGNL